MVGFLRGVRFKAAGPSISLGGHADGGFPATKGSAHTPRHRYRSAKTFTGVLLKPDMGRQTVVHNGRPKLIAHMLMRLLMRQTQMSPLLKARRGLSKCPCSSRC